VSHVADALSESSTTQLLAANGEASLTLFFFDKINEQQQ
jgi:hypothetical protein